MGNEDGLRKCGFEEFCEVYEGMGDRVGWGGWKDEG